MKKKRIAFIVVNYHGIPVFMNFLENISAHYDITVYSLNKSHQALPPANIQVKWVPFPGMMLRFRFLLLLVLVIKDHITSGYHLVHALGAYPSGMLSVTLKKIFKLPLVVHLHGGEVAYLPEIQFGDMVNSQKKKRTLWTLKNASIITSQSIFQAKDANKYIKGKPINAIPFGVDSHFFEYKRKILRPPFQFIHIGYCHQVKDQHTLLNAFVEISKAVEAHLTIIGKGHLNNEIHMHAKSMGVDHKIEFVESVPNNQIPDYYARAHIMLHTSLYEGQPAAVSEAMASGVVVCGTRVGLIDDLAPDCCIAVNKGDYKMLASKVIALLQNEKLYQVLRMKAVNWAWQHDAEWTVNQYKAIYNQLI